MSRALLAAGALLMSAPAYAAPPEEETSHVVKAGETLGGIANRAGVPATAIVKANGLKEPYVVRLGQKLSIPRAAKVTAKPVPKPTSSAASAELSAKKAEKTAARVIEARQPAGRPETETSHKVGEGETLGGIAARAKVPRVLIIEANGLQAPFDVRVGQTLRIPRTRRHEVKNGDTGFSISLDYAVPWEQIALANNLDADTPVKVGQNLLIPTLLDPPGASAKTLTPSPRLAAAPATSKSTRFAWPLSGPIRRGYATGSDYHDGVDITAPKGSMVRAAAAGTVTFAGKEKDQFGNLVVLDHGNGWFTAYGFLSRVTVKEGASVAAGERIGLVGDTGLAKGSELHFEVRQGGKPVDPLDSLPKAP
ncbi:membrane protein [Novosphingobium barchaimii LL02]|uniref:Membrane protein n=1 Tax=Novosphingobium barchaimii LL02 TaxID=1114963 RepID=A0A0J7Y8N5_9SPHN|nr:LysM peptidoglycan-binding domain-containing M23 family metallopeptidase [Novosphingobium barchaimii]KMS60201.1 membrane protein [Novosphingobium barchaimii LL02]